ncbi:GTP pyrophosphokinase [Mesobacillus selenatarsenatis]|uniref:GTP pyrophosphokinase n=1 Tax=Mesobacillus selenatarsenatis (strain DSM 18680 / JCM 14380 / FERM P-15431 / SF-1) TaxID=1321606 RepID=A0A0A8XCF2_MESS1|nr:GTP pyrophosphokinase family protein [Mesobacillus selenatarsenatis]GAM16707.1 GTP pyrophosphokinase [Mesobacillus selenatarsenatis SF-1]
MEELTQQYRINPKEMRNDLKRFSLIYKFALDEMNTKINILKEEFIHIHDYNPIEHCNSRLKSPESIVKKMIRKNLGLSIESIRDNIKDIAGIRIICPFITDVYKISQMIEKQRDIELVERKDYIKQPKPNGYQSLHLIIKIPVFMSDRVEMVFVELQIRTIAMDFWASLEHKIYYKYDKEIPERIKKDLKDAAISAAELDLKMERINNEVADLKVKDDLDADLLPFNDTPKTNFQSFLNGFFVDVPKEVKK